MKNKHTLIEGRKALDNNYDHKHRKPRKIVQEDIIKGYVIRETMAEMRKIIWEEICYGYKKDI